MKTILAALLATAPTLAAATVFETDPGDFFDFPNDGDGYHWLVDMTALSPGDVVVSFTVNAGPGPRYLQTFQIFGACTPDIVYMANFDIEVTNANGVDTDWTYATDGSDDVCGYHNYLDKILPAGLSTFEVTFVGAANAVPPLAQYADVRFGTVVPAVPLPSGIALMTGAICALGVYRTNQKSKRTDCA